MLTLYDARSEKHQSAIGVNNLLQLTDVTRNTHCVFFMSLEING
jgi:hypothetical protein